MDLAGSKKHNDLIGSFFWGLMTGLCVSVVVLLYTDNPLARYNELLKECQSSLSDGYQCEIIMIKRAEKMNVNK